MVAPDLVYSAGFTATGIVAGFTDWRTRRIPNALTFPAILLGFLAHGALGGWHGLVSSLIATGVIFAILLPLVAARGMGMGDYKLLLATSAFAGLDRFLWVLVFSALAGTILGFAMALRRHYLKRMFQNLPVVFGHMLRSPFTPHVELNIDNPKMLTFPFGVAVAAGCVATVAWSTLVIH